MGVAPVMVQGAPERREQLGLGWAGKRSHPVGSKWDQKHKTRNPDALVALQAMQLMWLTPVVKTTFFYYRF